MASNTFHINLVVFKNYFVIRRAYRVLFPRYSQILVDICAFFSTHVYFRYNFLTALGLREDRAGRFHFAHLSTNGAEWSADIVVPSSVCGYVDGYIRWVEKRLNTGSQWWPWGIPVLVLIFGSKGQSSRSDGSRVSECLYSVSAITPLWFNKLEQWEYHYQVGQKVWYP